MWLRIADTRAGALKRTPSPGPEFFEGQPVVEVTVELLPICSRFHRLLGFVLIDIAVLISVDGFGAASSSAAR